MPPAPSSFEDCRYEKIADLFTDNALLNNKGSYVAPPYHSLELRFRSRALR